MTDNPLKRLEAMGQSIWMDFIRRGVMTDGQLQRWIDEDGVSGVTSNPTIFEKAIVESHDYDDEVEELKRAGRTPAEIYELLTVEDIRQAAGLFRPTFDRTGGADGFVSIEVSPRLANDTIGTMAEARRLWQAVDRPNVMVKIPATREGLPAIRQMISEGINVNITLLFGLPRYQEVVDAYLTGLESRLVQRLPIDKISSVASFFLSRIDVLADPLLQKMTQDAGAAEAKLARALTGKAAIASAKLAYQIFERSLQHNRFLAITAKGGAQPQRVLWASTSTKNPAYSDVMYIEPLIGPQTINTMPVETLDAYRDHGSPAPRLKEKVEAAQNVMDGLARLGIQIDHLTQQLEVEGVEKFSRSYDKLIERLSEKVKVR